MKTDNGTTTADLHAFSQYCNKIDKTAPKEYTWGMVVRVRLNDSVLESSSVDGTVRAWRLA